MQPNRPASGTEPTTQPKKGPAGAPATPTDPVTGWVRLTEQEEVALLVRLADDRNWTQVVAHGLRMVGVIATAKQTPQLVTPAEAEACIAWLIGLATRAEHNRSEWASYSPHPASPVGDPTNFQGSEFEVPTYAPHPRGLGYQR